MRKVYCDKIYPHQETLLKAVRARKKLIMQIPRKHGLSYWQKITKKLMEEFENGKNDTEKA